MTTTTPTKPADPKQSPGIGSTLVTRLRALGGPVIGLIVMIVALSFLSPFFLTTRNLSNILSQISTIGIMAAGATLAFATGLGDFVTSIMLYTYDTRPISLEILSSLRQADIGVAAAYGVFLMVISALVFALGSERKTATG